MCTVRKSVGSKNFMHELEILNLSNAFRKIGMIVTTTPSIEGKRIVEYKGIVTGEAIMGANILRDFTAGIRDIIGGRSGQYEKILRRGRDIAVSEMQKSAEELGANAVIGVDVDYESVGQSGMLMISVSGTAVRAE
jgi:uncharacterized protein YbjQ (UPF0145 family)